MLSSILAAPLPFVRSQGFAGQGWEGAGATRQAPPVEEPRADPPPAPPPMLGPLATLATPAYAPPAAEASAGASGEAAPPAVASGEPEVTAPEEAAPVGPAPLPLSAYPLDRCAAIAASIGRRPEEAEQILEDEKLTGEVWEELHAHWLGEIEAEIDRGKKKMLAAYDTAYVGRLEKERGPITAREYAGLLLSSERRAADAELQKLGLPEESMMRIRRVWLSRTAKDPAAAAEVRAAMRAAAEE
jgi:hypothetical protein